MQVQNLIACKFAAVRDSVRHRKRVRKGQLQQIIAQVKSDKGVETEFLPSGIRWRLENNRQSHSPMLNS